MAIKRVFGTVDGAEVIMEQAEGDRWSVPVPLDQDGEYVVEIIAEDEAGNQSYMAKMLFCVDSSRLCVHVLPLPYMAMVMEDPYMAVLEPPRYYTEILLPDCPLLRREGH